MGEPRRTTRTSDRSVDRGADRKGERSGGSASDRRNRLDEAWELMHFALRAVIAVPDRMLELGQIAAYLHDIGNVINRVNHPLHGANIAFTLLNEMGMDCGEIVPILGAIGNHEELTGMPIGIMSAALIIADKSDVHFSRVQNPLMETFDIHDRVNNAVQRSRVEIRDDGRRIELVLEIDTKQASVMEYFEIFLSRMVMCRRSAQLLGYRFALSVNGTNLE